MDKFTALILLILLSGCAAQNTDDTVSYNDEDLICEYVAKTGSNLKRKTCMTRELSDELRKESEQDLREAWRKGQTQAHTNI
ncbi:MULTISPECIES: hypothetical protein [unclassified Shewanella]|uniref:hypothetical protein n=1 Tax=unclassified Shewanella TaxID=196818 RepID=UPI0006D65353|nr:hypothetical protein [Shewanella sp. P1-14-1]KPZ71785.1 hypothetical protein AN944_01439 [Shewanella sp. P1-14-1]